MYGDLVRRSSQSMAPPKSGPDAGRADDTCGGGAREPARGIDIRKEGGRLLAGISERDLSSVAVPSDGMQAELQAELA
jgi:hypothetical protein